MELRTGFFCPVLCHLLPALLMWKWHHDKDIMQVSHGTPESADDSTTLLGIIRRSAGQMVRRRGGSRLCYMFLIENGSGRPSFGCTCSTASCCWDCWINYGA
ncbi:hypothetical protein SEVIR_5G364200v4 [Setaria viridis]|uniref:Secreted protein n=1 Tax=Setaria viridis TaxID=4556 RepID=A0A4U6UP68_SETVI|nr:hypothetical protein SEVIR_5G364200v2 [Setaria viridis]